MTASLIEGGYLERVIRPVHQAKQKLEYTQSILSELTEKSLTATERSVCFDEMRSRAERAKRWKWHRPQRMGPPLKEYGEWKVELHSFTVKKTSRVSLFTSLDPGRQKDLSRSQVWVEAKGSCRPLKNVFETVILPQGKHRLLHYGRLTSPMSASEKDRQGSRVLFSW